MAKKAQQQEVEQQEVEQQEVELFGMVTIVGISTLKNGKEYHVTAELAKTLIKKGFAKLK
jgi:hypothetical protein